MAGLWPPGVIWLRCCKPCGGLGYAVQRQMPTLRMASFAPSPFLCLAAFTCCVSSDPPGEACECPYLCKPCMGLGPPYGRVCWCVGQVWAGVCCHGRPPPRCGSLPSEIWPDLACLFPSLSYDVTLLSTQLVSSEVPCKAAAASLGKRRRMRIHGTLVINMPEACAHACRKAGQRQDGAVAHLPA